MSGPTKAPAPLPLPEVRALTPKERNALLWFEGAALAVLGLGLWKPAEASFSATLCQGSSEAGSCVARGEYRAVRFFRYPSTGGTGEPQPRIRILCKSCASRWAKKYGAMIPELDRFHESRKGSQ